MARMASLYRGMDRAALDAAYNDGAAVADSARFIAAWENRSAEVRAALAVSGIYDLEPIRLNYLLNYLNEKLRLDDAEARRNSPLLHLPAGAAPLIVTVGGNELPELRRQSETYYAAWREHGLPGKFVPLPWPQPLYGARGDGAAGRRADPGARHTHRPKIIFIAGEKISSGRGCPAQRPPITPYPRHSDEGPRAVDWPAILGWPAFFMALSPSGRRAAAPAIRRAAA